MDAGPRGLLWGARAPGPLELALLFVFSLWLLAEAVRALTGAALAQPLGSEAPGTAAVEPAVARCGLVKRAVRTWVEFGPGLGPDDLVTSAHSAAAAVHALDAAFCAAFVHGERVPSLDAQRADLQESLRRGRFEVSRVLLSGATVTQAQLWMHAARESASRTEWSVALSRVGERWDVSSLSRAPLP